MSERERLASEISRVYRVVLAGRLDDDDAANLTLGEMHQEAGEAVVGWLEQRGITLTPQLDRLPVKPQMALDHQQGKHRESSLPRMYCDSCEVEWWRENAVAVKVVCPSCGGTSHVPDPKREYPGDPCTHCEDGKVLAKGVTAVSVMGQVAYYRVPVELVEQGDEDGS